MKDRKLGRNEFNEIVMKNGLGMSADDCDRFTGYHEKVKPGDIPVVVQQEKLNAEYLLKTDRVNELTAEFIRTMKKQVAHEFEDGPGEVNMYEWLRTLMFVASTTAAVSNAASPPVKDWLRKSFLQLDQYRFTNLRSGAIKF